MRVQAPPVTQFMNAFNKQILDKDNSGLIESCDICNKLIFNFNMVGDAATLNEDGLIICLTCLKLSNLNLN